MHNSDAECGHEEAPEATPTDRRARPAFGGSRFHRARATKCSVVHRILVADPERRRVKRPSGRGMIDGYARVSTAAQDLTGAMPN